MVYSDLTVFKEHALMSPKAVFLSTFALCGFANLGSVGIQLGGIGVLVPEKRPMLAGLGVRALLGGILTAAIAGMFFQG